MSEEEAGETIERARAGTSLGEVRSTPSASGKGLPSARVTARESRRSSRCRADAESVSRTVSTPCERNGIVSWLRL